MQVLKGNGREELLQVISCRSQRACLSSTIIKLVFMGIIEFKPVAFSFWLDLLRWFGCLGVVAVHGL